MYYLADLVTPTSVVRHYMKLLLFRTRKTLQICKIYENLCVLNYVLFS